jgi:hypothetical protein
MFRLQKLYKLLHIFVIYNILIFNENIACLDLTKLLNKFSLGCREDAVIGKSSKCDCDICLSSSLYLLFYNKKI